MVKFSISKEEVKEALSNNVLMAVINTVCINAIYILISSFILNNIFKAITVSMFTTVLTVLFMFIKKKAGVYENKPEKWFYNVFTLQMVISFVVVLFTQLLTR